MKCFRFHCEPRSPIAAGPAAGPGIAAARRPAAATTGPPPPPPKRGAVHARPKTEGQDIEDQKPRTLNRLGKKKRGKMKHQDRDDDPEGDPQARRSPPTASLPLLSPCWSWFGGAAGPLVLALRAPRSSPRRPLSGRRRNHPARNFGAITSCSMSLQTESGSTPSRPRPTSMRCLWSSLKTNSTAPLLLALLANAPAAVNAVAVILDGRVGLHLLVDADEDLVGAFLFEGFQFPVEPITAVAGTDGLRVVVEVAVRLRAE